MKYKQKNSIELLESLLKQRGGNEKEKGTKKKKRGRCSLALLSLPFFFSASWNSEMMDGDWAATLEYEE